MRDGTAKKILTLTVHSCQLPTASCTTNFNGNICHLLIDLHSSMGHKTDIWNLRSCCQMPVAKQTSMETKLSPSYLLALVCIHPIYLPTSIWLGCAWGSAKKRSWHCTQLPVATCKAWGSLIFNICSNLLEKDTSLDLCMTAEGNLIDQRCKTLNGKRVCKFDFFYSHLFIWFHKKNDWFEFLIAAG